VDAQVRELLLTLHLRSLVTYHLIALTADSLLIKKDVDKLEIQLYLEYAKLTSQMSKESILNIKYLNQDSILRSHPKIIKEFTIPG
jgi:hypothetical protein